MMKMEKKLLTAVIAAGLLAAVIAVGFWYLSNGKNSITVLAAGSLAVPFQKLSEIYENKYGIEVKIETAGSIETVKKVSELHRQVDVVAVADYKAIAGYLVPNYTSWYVRFAKNALVIVYTEHSKYASTINTTNWPDILERDDVRIGFSSPNDDPCGYRAVMMFYLSDFLYEKNIFQNLVENNTAIHAQNGEILVPDDSTLLKNQGKIYIKQKSVSLLGDLETGNIDYAIEYLSVAKQHNLKYIPLPDKINLSNSTLADFYSRAKVKLADGKIVKGDAINYAITVPNNAPNKNAAYQFVKLLLSNEGREVLQECGQPPMYQEWGKVPEEIKT